MKGVDGGGLFPPAQMVRGLGRLGEGLAPVRGAEHPPRYTGPVPELFLGLMSVFVLRSGYAAKSVFLSPTVLG